MTTTTEIQRRYWFGVYRSVYRNSLTHCGHILARVMAQRIADARTQQKFIMKVIEPTSVEAYLRASRGYEMKPVRKTIRRSQLGNLAMAAGREDSVTAVILDGNFHRWVGIGWVDEGKATEAQKKKFPRVIN